MAEWKTRAAELDRLASIANAGRRRALRFRGPGTDLEVGLFGTSRWVSAADRTTSGHVHYANLPSEDIFTTPDPDRVSGYLTIWRGRPLSDGRVVRDALLRFEDGRVVEVRGEGAADGLHARIAVDAFAVTDAGDEIPVVAGGAWAL